MVGIVTLVLMPVINDDACTYSKRHRKDFVPLEDWGYWHGPRFWQNESSTNCKHFSLQWSTNSFLGVGLSSCLSRASWEVPSGSSCNVRGGYRFSTLCIFGLPRLALGILVSVGSSQSEAARFWLLCTRSMILFSQDPWELKGTMQSLGTDNKNSNMILEVCRPW